MENTEVDLLDRCQWCFFWNSVPISSYFLCSFYFLWPFYFGWFFLFLLTDNINLYMPDGVFSPQYADSRFSGYVCRLWLNLNFLGFLNRVVNTLECSQYYFDAITLCVSFLFFFMRMSVWFGWTIGVNSEIITSQNVKEEKKNNFPSKEEIRSFYFSYFYK